MNFSARRDEFARLSMAALAGTDAIALADDGQTHALPIVLGEASDDVQIIVHDSVLEEELKLTAAKGVSGLLQRTLPHRPRRRFSVLMYL